MLLSDYVTGVYIPARIELAKQYRKKLEAVAGMFSSFLGRPAGLADFTQQNVCNYLTQYRRQWSARSTNNQRQVLLSVWQDAADSTRHAALLSELPNRRRIRKLKEDAEPPRCFRKRHLRALVAHIRTLPGMVGDVPAALWWLSLVVGHPLDLVADRRHAGREVQRLRRRRI